MPALSSVVVGASGLAGAVVRIATLRWPSASERANAMSVLLVPGGRGLVDGSVPSWSVVMRSGIRVAGLRRTRELHVGVQAPRWTPLLGTGGSGGECRLDDGDLLGLRLRLAQVDAERSSAKSSMTSLGVPLGRRLGDLLRSTSPSATFCANDFSHSSLSRTGLSTQSRGTSTRSPGRGDQHLHEVALGATKLAAPAPRTTVRRRPSGRHLQRHRGDRRADEVDHVAVGRVAEVGGERAEAAGGAGRDRLHDVRPGLP
jgi:hypothetical protein